MSFYVYREGKRGRPNRFEEHDNALLSSILTIIDARRHIRGRKPETTSLVIANSDGITAIHDTWTDIKITIKDSVAHKCAGTKLDKRIKNVVNVGSSGEVSVAATITRNNIDFSKIKNKIEALKKEAATKKIDL